MDKHLELSENEENDDYDPYCDTKADDYEICLSSDESDEDDEDSDDE